MLLADLAMVGCAVFRLTMVLTGRRVGRATGAADPQPLPRYTVLVPLYREGNMVDRLVRRLSTLDYPVGSTQILLLCEQDDEDTLSAVDRTGLVEPFRLVVCPPGSPRTKARACNIGLRYATGELCVICDAEDRPEPDQLRRAAATFAAAPARVACLQASLAFHNRTVNWLTRCFTLEYGTLFGFVLPGLTRWGLPVPLGGTSNHFRTRMLTELGGWDPYNVTEDAELGLRLHGAGYRTAMLPSATLEEACAVAGPWLRQRTRWLKGYLQTWVVHTRRDATSPLDRLAVHTVIGSTVLAVAPLPVLLGVLALVRTPLWPGSTVGRRCWRRRRPRRWARSPPASWWVPGWCPPAGIGLLPPSPRFRCTRCWSRRRRTGPAGSW